MSLFPIIQPQAQPPAELPLCKEVQWDYRSNAPIWRGGRPHVVTGAEAVLSWAYRALQVPRRRFEAYTWDYGNDCERLVGSAYSEDVRRAEAARYVRECLRVNPYIDEVRDIEVRFDAGRLTVACRLSTIYGEVELNV